jgi:hypothetical protein
VADELAGLAQGGRRDPDRREKVAAEQERQALRVDAIILEARGGDGLGLFGMREDRLMAEALEQIHQPPPGAGGLDGDRRLRWQLREELLHAGHLVLESMLGQFAILGQDRDLRRSFVQVDPDVCHRVGLLP